MAVGSPAGTDKAQHWIRLGKTEITTVGTRGPREKTAKVPSPKVDSASVIATKEPLTARSK